MGGRWRAVSLLLARAAKSHLPFVSNSPPPLPVLSPSALSILSLGTAASCLGTRPLSASAVASRVSSYGDEAEDGFDYASELNYEEDTGNIPIKAYFLSTSIDLKSLQSENLSNVLPPTSRSSNYVALKYPGFSTDMRDHGAKASQYRFMVVCQYGSVILFNIDDYDTEGYLDVVRRHATGLLRQTWKDDYAVKEKPLLDEDMKGGPDYLVLKALDTDGIRLIGSVLGQSIALDYFVSQVDGMVEEFAFINRKLENSGTFTMDRKKLLQLVGKANSNLADVILKVGLFERSEIAWREAKYAQIYDYLREEYEITQRFGNLNFKLKFVERWNFFMAAQHSFPSRSSPKQQVKSVGMVHHIPAEHRECYIVVRDPSGL